MLYNNILKSTYSQNTLDAVLISFYEDWKTQYLRKVQDTSPLQEYLFYTFDQPTDNNAVTCSEAMGYGMCIFPMMSPFDKDAKKHFQALYNFIKCYPSYYNPNLMAWQQIETPDGHIVNSSNKTSSATDGDMDIAYGLLLAHRLWGKGNDASTYLNDALLRMNALMTSCVFPQTSILLLGDWVIGLDHGFYTGITRSSDFITYILKSFMQVDKQNIHKWKNVLLRIYSIIHFQMTRQSILNGLMPDFFVRSANHYIAPTYKVLESIHDGDYYYNSCRTPWRYAMDSILYHTPVSHQLRTLNTWVQRKTNGRPTNIMSGYYLAGGIPGTSFGTPGQLSFIAPFLVSALCQPNNDPWKLALWDFIISTPITSGTFYDNTLKLMALIVATGNWIAP